MRILILGLSGLLLVGAALSAWYVHAEREALDHPLRISSPSLRLVIEPGATLFQVAGDLADRGVLARPSSLVWYARWQGAAKQIKAGEYEVPAGTTPLALLELLIVGKVKQWSFTIVEGWTFKQLRAALIEYPNLVHTLAGVDDTEVMERLGRPGENPEGWFFPDTYYFPSGTTDLDFIARALHARRDHLAREWSQRDPDLPYLEPYEALTMASIVEKETANPEERARIAGVFVRRLRRGMRLEADPTVIYGLGEAFDGNLRRRDLKRKTLYNTYLVRGLPPTPIAMPGGAAVHAALHPEPGAQLFFVAKGNGSHEFSVTYEQHKAAVKRYQLQRKKAKTGNTDE